MLLFVNVSDQPVNARLDLDLKTLGLPSGKLSIERITADNVALCETLAAATQ